MNSLFQIESHDEFKNVTVEVLNTLYSKSSTILETNTISQAKEELKQILSSNNFDLTKVRDKLQRKEWNEDRIKLFVNALEEKSSELLYSSFLHHNSKYGDAVVNFDWRLKIILGTSELKTLRHSLLQLLLTTNSNVNQRQKTYELNKDMLKRFIDALEGVNTLE